MAFWSFRRAKMPQADTASRMAYVDSRQLLLYQQWSSPFSAPIVKNMAPMRNIALEQMPTVIPGPAVTMSGYGGVVTGQALLQPLQPTSVGTGSGGL